MSGLGDLYQEVILDHSRQPRNFHMIDTENVAKGHNPLCGDRYTVYVKLSGGTIEDIAFEGQGCAISKASASLMTQAVKGRSRAVAVALFEAFHHLVMGEALGAADLESLGKLRALAGVAQFPARVKCASLAWHTMRAALDKAQGTVSLE